MEVWYKMKTKCAGYTVPLVHAVSNGSVHVTHHMSRSIMGQATKQGWQQCANTMQLLVLNQGRYAYSEGMWLQVLHSQSLQQPQ